MLNRDELLEIAMNGADLAASGETHVHFFGPDGDYLDEFVPMFGVPEHFDTDGDNGKAAYVGGDYSFIAEGTRLTITEAWLVGGQTSGEDGRLEGSVTGAAVHVFDPPLEVGGGTEGGTDYIVVPSGSMVFGDPA